ncbi:hypothetical protein LguiB_027343 [Lonicera macranthoides]
MQTKLNVSYYRDRGAKVLSHCREFGEGVHAGRSSLNQYADHPRKKKDGDNVEDGLDVDGEDGLRWEDVEDLQLKYLSETGVPLDDDEAFKQVLGYRSGYIRGRGAGPKSISSSIRAKKKRKRRYERQTSS